MATRKHTLSHVFVSESPIHGKGLYANESIKRGTYIGEYEGPVAKRNGTYVLWILEEGKAEYGISGRNKLRYLNHSNKPNAEFDGSKLYALKNIKNKAEITFHYGEDPAG